MITHITDYLTWARAMSQWLEGRENTINLFASATREPYDMLMADLEAVGLQDLLARMNQPMSWGHPQIVAAIARHYGIPDPERILITSGGSMAFVIVGLTLAAPGTHAIVETPVYQPFLNVLQKRGVSVSPLVREPDTFAVDPSAVERLIRPDTHLIVLTNLHNPSSALLDDHTLREIADIAGQNNSLVVVDEVYRDLVPDAAPGARCAALLADNIITVSSLSKAYGLGRLRVGWITAAPPVMAALREVHVTFDNSTSAIDQAVASVVFEKLESYRQHGQAAAAANRPLIAQFAAEMQAADRLHGHAPPYGCVYFPRVNGVPDTSALAERLLETHQLVVVPGRFFSAPAHIRISFGGDPAVVRAGIDRLADALISFQP
ncbi:MAG: pyridoxal phosphate-dependent aminotransferase [Anaerolineae bacterium]|nr:pyridoxal phosphate-dependent aminotransferase [Anaerolineae bacterium]